MRLYSGIIKTTIIIFGLLLAGCSNGPSLAPETPTPTNTSIPTNTSTPTIVPTVTNTPVPPTPTPTPPSVLLNYIDSIVVTDIDPFESNKGWELYAGNIYEGSLKLNGKDWNGLMKKGIFREGEGIIINFKYDKPAEFEIFFDYGEFYTDAYRRFGIYISSSSDSSNLWLGKNGLGFNNLHGNFRTKPDTWYSLLMAVNDDGEFLAVIWDPNDPSKIITYHERAGEKWAGYEWDFRIGANEGNIEFDDFMKITFDEMK